ncbi:MAG: hypothetical protein AB8B53_00595 [Flavobacteriales bacterium]
MLFLIILTAFSTWDLINITETHLFISDIPFNDNSSSHLFWLLDCPILIIGLLFSQLLWFKFFNSSRNGKIIWVLLVLILASMTPFISALFAEDAQWSVNQIQAHIQHRDVPIRHGENQAGIVLTSSSKPYIPALIMFVIVAVLALIIARRKEPKPSELVSQFTKKHNNW